MITHKRKVFEHTTLALPVLQFTRLRFYSFPNFHKRPEQIYFMKLCNYYKNQKVLRDRKFYNLCSISVVFCWRLRNLKFLRKNYTSYFILYWYLIVWGTRRCSWLKHCAINLKVAGSIPDGVIGIFHWRNPSCRTMALGLTQPLK
jgi:hypothetical protein